MKIIYQGTDITDYLDVEVCTFRDAAGGRSASLELVTGDPERWGRWGPQPDDEITASAQSVSSRRMYVAHAAAEGRRFRILATAMPEAGRRKSWRSFQHASLRQMLEACRADTGMDWAVYGPDPDASFIWAMREYESWPSFLSRLLVRESAAVSCWDGMLTVIGVEYAQSRLPVATLKITDEEESGVSLTRESSGYWAGVTVRMGDAAVSAEDTGRASAANRPEFAHTAARQADEAGRWARGLLLDHNRRQETLGLETELQQAFQPMVRIDTTGREDTAGSWLVESVSHDLLREKTAAELLRCVTTVR